MTSTEGLTTSVVTTGGESSQPGGLQVSEEAIAAIVEETFSSIADIIEELSQAGGSEVLMNKAGGASTSVGDVAEGLSQPKESHEGVHLQLFNQMGYNKILISQLWFFKLLLTLLQWL